MKDCKKCPFDPGMICKECKKDSNDTLRLCHMLLDMMPKDQAERAYLLLNRLYCGSVVTADDAESKDSEIIRLTAKLMNRMDARQKKLVYSYACKLYCGG